ncbi:MAG TPA: ribonuclease HI family protein [Anaerolineae bacterium]|jgi:ribonuclease HI|nr:ribonuclease HI family protein [Anaerolineae bacterium]
MVGHKRIVVYSDGAARGNPGPAGAGGQVLDSSGNTLAEISQYLGETTNNVAEYKALIITLEHALLYAPDEIEVRSDSELMVKHLLGEYRVKNEGLKPLFEKVKQLLARVKKIDIKHIYRSENTRADELANKAIDEFTKAERVEAQVDEFPEQGSLF